MEFNFDESAFYTPCEISNLLNISLRAIYGILHRDEISAIKLGGRWRIYGNDLQNYLENNKINTS